jgi:hypothetical protein
MQTAADRAGEPGPAHLYPIAGAPTLSRSRFGRVASLCGRPGCSETGVVAYGMVPEDLLFWIAPLEQAPISDASVLCQRHADAMVVPRNWTLDDRREDVLRLFRPRPADPARVRPVRRSRPKAHAAQPEQLQIDGTGEIGRPTPEQAAVEVPTPDGSDDAAAPWEPDFDHADDLGGLLEVKSPLLARAFRGTDRPKR